MQSTGFNYAEKKQKNNQVPKKIILLY